MKIPSIRQAPPGIEQPDAPPSRPPLEITVTQTIEDRTQALMLQEVSYGLRSNNSRTAIHVMIWVWAAALLMVAAFWYDDIRTVGFRAFLSGSQIVAALPGLLLLVLLTLVHLLWSRRSGRRRSARYRRHLALIGEAAPRAVSFRFDGEGITSAEQGGSMHLQSWHDQVTLMEDERWLCFTAHMHELSIVIPKSEVSAEALDAVRAWNEVRGQAGRPSEPAIPRALTGREVAVSHEFTSGRDDMIATLTEGMNSPAWRRQRTIGYAKLAIALCLLTPALYLIGWIIDPDRLPFDITWPLYLSMFGTVFWQPALAALAFLGIAALVLPLLQRWSARYYADRILANGVGTGITVVGENGIWDSNTGLRMFIPWHAMRAFRITPEHILVTVRLGAVIAYPKHVFPADAIAGIEAMVRERAGKPLETGEAA